MRLFRLTALWLSLAALVNAQTPQRGAAPQTPARTAAPVMANLSQLMKGILYPASNVIFAAQSQNPADVKPASDPSLATDPLASTYGKWEAVENSALALNEAANLLTIPGRKCSNGRAACWKRAGRSTTWAN